MPIPVLWSKSLFPLRLFVRNGGFRSDLMANKGQKMRVVHLCDQLLEGLIRPPKCEPPDEKGCRIHPVLFLTPAIE